MIRVLIVDDKLESLYLLRALLQGNGCTVEEARHGAEALVKARQLPPDLIVSDLLMPVMDGYTLLSHWKADERLRAIPFVVYTATYTEPQDERLALDLGADAFILKPAEPEAFMARLQEVLTKAQRGELPARHPPIVAEEPLLTEYSKVLVRKLEEKARQLQEANRALQEDLAQRRRAEAEAERARATLLGTLENQRRIEEELRQEQILFRSLAGAIPDHIYFKDRQSRFVRINDTMAQHFKLGSPADAIGKTDFDFFSEEHARQAYDDEQRIIKTGEPLVGVEEKETWPDGHTTWVSTTKVPLKDSDGKITGMVGISRDITERKRAEDALRVLSLRQEAILTAVPDIIAEVDVDKVYTWMNPAGFEFFGDDAIGKEAAFYFDGVQDTYGAVQPLFNGNPNVIYVESWQRRRDGERRLLAWWCRMLKDVNGHVTGALSTGRDITERRRADEHVREQARLLDTATDGIMVRDLQHRILYWNKGCERHYGWSAEEAVGRPSPELLAVDRTVFDAACARVLRKDEWTGEMRQLTKARQEIIVLSRWSLVRDSQGQPSSVLVINTDITERKKLETQLFRAQRLESIGQLASGIAHDLNNILAPLVMIVPLLREEIKNPDTLQLLDIMEANTQRGVDVVKQVLTFSRGLQGGKGPVPLRPLLKELGAMLDETLPRSITVQVTAPESLWLIEADPTQVHQVLMNLCVNARDAMPDGGVLSVEAENVDVDEAFAGLTPGAKAGPHVVLLVADTGTGIPPEHMDRIFDPFFTTKEPGKGTGLGLATVLGIVRDHGGFIRVESKPGKGTQFRVYLPAKPESRAAPAAEPAAAAPRGQGETILVVDDEESVRMLTRRILEDYGYHVLLAGEGSEAVVVFAQHAPEIRAVLTDLVMPLMDGAALIRALQKMAPAVKVLAASGTIEAAQVATARRLGVKLVLQKPYSQGILLHGLRAVLDEREIPKAGRSTAPVAGEGESRSGLPPRAPK